MSQTRTSQFNVYPGSSVAPSSPSSHRPSVPACDSAPITTRLQAPPTSTISVASAGSLVSAAALASTTKSDTSQAHAVAIAVASSSVAVSVAPGSALCAHARGHDLGHDDELISEGDGCRREEDPG